MCSKCPPSTETHAGWSHLIWHNFVTVGDNWIKISNLAYIWTFNRRMKYGLKITNRLGEMRENGIVRFGQWWTFCAHGWSRSIWHNFVKVAGNWIKIRSLAYVGTSNRHVKFSWKIPNRFGKIATSPQGGFFWFTLYMCIIRHLLGKASGRGQGRVNVIWKTRRRDYHRPPRISDSVQSSRHLIDTFAASQLVHVGQIEHGRCVGHGLIHYIGKIEYRRLTAVDGGQSWAALGCKPPAQGPLTTAGRAVE